MRKGEIARNEQFLLFPQCFVLIEIIVSLFVHIFEVISLFAGEFEECKIGISGKGLNFVLAFDYFSLFQWCSLLLCHTKVIIMAHFSVLFGTMTLFCFEHIQG